MKSETILDIVLVVGLVAALGLMATAPLRAAPGLTDESHGQALKIFTDIHTQCDAALGEMPKGHFDTPYHVGIYYSMCMSSIYKHMAETLEQKAAEDFKEL